MDVLRIRGKRTRQQPQTTDMAASRPRGRPMKPASELLANKVAKLQQRSTLSKELTSSVSTDETQRTRSISPLETLPTELVQQVFFHCLEVNMVKASPVFIKMFSTASTYQLLILFAFFDDDGINPVESDHFKPAKYRKIPIEEKIRLQEAILGCRWCSLERVEGCMPTLTRLKMVQEWHKEHNITETWPRDPPPRRRGCVAPPSLPLLEDNEALEHYFHVHLRRWELERINSGDKTSYLPRLRPYTVMLTKDGRGYIKQLRSDLPYIFPSTLAVRHIPDQMLVGQPWTTKKVRFLRLLRQGFRHLQRDISLRLSAEALFRGMEDAVVENDPNTLQVLLELHDLAFHISSHKISGQPVVNSNPHGQCYTTPHSHPIPLRLFWLASKQEYKHANVLISLLVRAGIDSIPKDDPIMTKWALEAATNDSAPRSVAEFVLRYMEGTLSLDSHGGLFYHGGLSGYLNSEYKFDSCDRFSVQIGYETTLYPRLFSVEVESGNYV